MISCEAASKCLQIKVYCIRCYVDDKIMILYVSDTIQLKRSITDMSSSADFQDCGIIIIQQTITKNI